MVFISTVGATYFLPLCLPLLPARNGLICNSYPPKGGGGGGGVSRIWVVLLHHCIHTENNMLHQHIKQQQYTSYNTKP